MNINIRNMLLEDKSEILQMMHDFYSSDAVNTNGSPKIFETDFECCISESPFLEGFVFENSGKILGYAMVAQCFSTEFGKPCFWLEDLYLKSEYRGFGIISIFVNYIKSHKQNAIFKLEVEKENVHAVHVYKKLGFKEMPYSEMIML